MKQKMCIYNNNYMHLNISLIMKNKNIIKIYTPITFIFIYINVDYHIYNLNQFHYKWKC